MTQAEKFMATVGDLDQMSDVDLLFRAREACGRAPEIYKSSSNKSQDYYFHFDDGSILNVDILEPERARHVSVQAPK